MQRGIGRAAGRRDDGCRVLQCLAGDDVARADIPGDKIRNHLAGQKAEFVANLVRRRRAGRIGQSQADRFGDCRHGVGGKLRAARTGRRAGVLLQRFQIGVIHRADRVFADRLIDVLDGDGLAFERAGQDRAAVNIDRRHIEPAHRHHHARLRLVAAGDPDQGVIGMAAHRQFHRIGNDFARRQGRFHPLVAHGDAVGHGNGAEFARRRAAGGDAKFHRLGLAHQRDIAGRRLVPAGGDADEWLMNLLPRQPHRVIKRAMRRTVGAFGRVPAGQARFQIGFGVHTSAGQT